MATGSCMLSPLGRVHCGHWAVCIMATGPLAGTTATGLTDENSGAQPRAIGQTALLLFPPQMSLLQGYGRY